ncbi:uncharacterized protein [Arachis hypogaea]|uniref:uncharacterized protein n=1 Tax=Arachis hypogaea TaxID=3818 RepID=UPI000DED1BEF|nr:uncharacterized protein LOC112720948 [Arachis hypogaea]
MIVDDSLDGDRLAVVTRRDSGASRPKVIFIDEEKKVLSESYIDSIVIKVLGKRVNYTAIVHKFKFIWRLKGGYEVLNVGFEYFLVKCDLKEDREKILLRGLWMIDGHYLAVKPWTISFRPAEESFGTNLVWIHIIGLNIHYYQKKAMRRIATAMGDPIKVDVATKEAERGKFTKACVFIDLGFSVID